METVSERLDCPSTGSRLAPHDDGVETTDVAGRRENDGSGTGGHALELGGICHHDVVVGPHCAKLFYPSRAPCAVRIRFSVPLVHVSWWADWLGDDGPHGLRGSNWSNIPDVTSPYTIASPSLREVLAFPASGRQFVDVEAFARRTVGFAVVDDELSSVTP